jgi:hypothetical protein
VKRVTLIHESGELILLPPGFAFEVKKATYIGLNDCAGLEPWDDSDPSVRTVVMLPDIDEEPLDAA